MLFKLYLNKKKMMFVVNEDCVRTSYFDLETLEPRPNFSTGVSFVTSAKLALTKLTFGNSLVKNSGMVPSLVLSKSTTNISAWGL